MIVVTITTAMVTAITTTSDKPRTLAEAPVREARGVPLHPLQCWVPYCQELGYSPRYRAFGGVAVELKSN